MTMTLLKRLLQTLACAGVLLLNPAFADESGKAEGADAAPPAAPAPGIGACSERAPSAVRPCSHPRRAARAAAKAAPVAAADKADKLLAAPKQLILSLGEIRVLDMPGKISRVALGKGAVLSTTTVDAGLLVIGEQLGDTSMMVWTGSGVTAFRVSVVPQDLGEVRRKVHALIGDTKGIAVTQVGTDLVLSGTAHRDTLARLGRLLSGMPNVINNIVEDQGSPMTRSVLFRLTFVEVKKSLLEQIGIKWNKDAVGPTFGATGIAKDTGIYHGPGPGEDGDNLLSPNPPFITRNGTTGGVFLGLATTVTSRLNFGVNNGDARVLATPELTARSGGKARLQVGGEVPIPLAGAFGATTVEFKPYGLLLSVEPQVDANNTITAKLSTEMSEIDSSVSVGGIPGFITRNTSTEISVKPGEVVALSGLVNSDLASSVDRLPGLSRVPLFGRLFRSDDFRNRKTELVVLVQTEIIAPGDGLAAQLRERGQGMEREFEAKVKQAGAPGESAAPAPVKEK